MRKMKQDGTLYLTLCNKSALQRPRQFVPNREYNGSRHKMMKDCLMVKIEPSTIDDTWSYETRPSKIEDLGIDRMSEKGFESAQEAQDAASKAIKFSPHFNDVVFDMRGF